MSEPTSMEIPRIEITDIDVTVDDTTPRIQRNGGCLNLQDQEEVQQTMLKVQEYWEKRTQDKDRWPGGHE